jgi:hypothetical protein
MYTVFEEGDSPLVDNVYVECENETGRTVHFAVYPRDFGACPENEWTDYPIEKVQKMLETWTTIAGDRVMEEGWGDD